MMKSHRIKLAITGFIALMGIATAAYAQSAAEIGAMHNNCNHPNYQGDRSRCGGGNRAPVSAEVWEDRYGAIAEDPVKGGGGVSEDEKSKRSADRIAISRCGTNQCKVVSRVRNTCQAIAYGEGLRFFGDGASEQLAANDAIAKCEQKGTKCELKYTGCSLPVRVK